MKPLVIAYDNEPIMYHTLKNGMKEGEGGKEISIKTVQYDVK